MLLLKDSVAQHYYLLNLKKRLILLEHVMGLEKIGEEGEYIRFRSTADIGNIVDLKKTSSGRA